MESIEMHISQLEIFATVISTIYWALDICRCPKSISCTISCNTHRNPKRHYHPILEMRRPRLGGIEVTSQLQIFTTKPVFLATMPWPLCNHIIL